MKVKTILVSQPEPKIENSPYFDLSEKQKVKIDFRPFIHVEGVSSKEIRQQKVDLNSTLEFNIADELITTGVQANFVNGSTDRIYAENVENKYTFLNVGVTLICGSDFYIWE